MFRGTLLKGRLVGLEFTLSKFLELRVEFYPFMVQRWKEKEFIELNISDNITVIQYASKFIELSRFVPEFVSSERLKMKRFEEGLAFYIWNELAGQPILTYQELYKWAAEVERVKIELRALNPINQKRKAMERGALSESVNQKKPSLAPPKSRPTSLTGPYWECRRTSHTTLECRVGTNNCM